MYIVNGIVLLLDALGAKTQTIEDSREYMRFINEGVEFFNEKLNENKIHPLEIRTFGDTILLDWEIKEDTDIEKLLDEICRVARVFLAIGYQSGFPLRGAISHGGYEKTDLAILGPALTDAAQWHQQADWIGCIATPTFSFWLDHLALSKKISESLYLYNYDVPLTGDKKKSLKTWAIYWGDVLGSGKTTENSDAVGILNELSFYTAKLQFPVGTEQKYSNTREFLIYCASNTHKHLSFNTVAGTLSS